MNKTILFAIALIVGSAATIGVQKIFWSQENSKESDVKMPTDEIAQKFLWLDEKGNRIKELTVRAHYDQAHQSNVVTDDDLSWYLDRTGDLLNKKKFGEAFLGEDVMSSPGDGYQLQALKQPEQQTSAGLQSQVNVNISRDLLEDSKTSFKTEEESETKKVLEVFKVNLYKDNIHPNVKFLQQALAVEGFPVADGNNEGSLKNPTENYKDKTIAKVAEWKKANKACIESFGPFNPSGEIFDAAARACMNVKLLEKGLVDTEGKLIVN